MNPLDDKDLDEALAGAASALGVEPPTPVWTESNFARLGRFEAGGRPWILKVVADDEDSERRYYADHPSERFPTVLCAGSGARPGMYWLLLEDLTATHEPSWERPKSPRYAARLGEAVARLHREAKPVPAVIPEIYPARLHPGFARLGPDVEARFLAGLAETVDEEGDRFIEFHGDLNPGNILIRRDGDEDPRLIDRQPLDFSIRNWTPEGDLALAIGPWWSPAERDESEAAALAAFAEASGRDEAAVRRSYARARWLAVGVVAEWRSEPDQEARMEWLWQKQWARIEPTLDSVS